MEIDKRDFPIAVLESLERFAEKSSDLFKRVDKEGVLLRFEDNHEHPKLYFEFESYERRNSIHFLKVNIKPKSRVDHNGHTLNLELSQGEGHFKNWVSYLEKYESISVFDDPILNQYEEEIYSEFEIIDEDADVKSYDLSTQIWLDEYIGGTLKKLEKYDPENNEAIQDIKRDLEELKDTQTKLTKRQVVKFVSKIYAKARKEGLRLFSDIWIEGKKEVIKQLIKTTIEIAKNSEVI